MSTIPLDIIQFIEHPDLLNDRSLSDTQRVILKSIYGLALNQSELEIYFTGTGRDKYDAVEQREATVIAGRRSGKTSKIAPPIAIYEAFRNHGLPEGEEAYVMLLAPQIAQAKIAFRNIRRYLRKSRILSQRIVNETKDEIRLDNGVTICCYPCSFIAVRGVTIVAAVCDEMAFWRHDSGAANPEQEIIDALHPGMANVVHPKLIKISTPFSKQGILWTEFQNRADLNFPVWQVPTFQMNPAFSSAALERERQRDDQKFRREFMAEFSENITAWIDPEVLDPCIVRHRKELPYVPGVCYVAAIDPAFLHDDFALNISHTLPDGTVVLDLLARWRGTKKRPLGFEFVTREIKYLLDMYRINKIVGDQYCAPVIRQQLLKLGIYYQDFAFGSHTRAGIFGNLKHLLIQGKIELLDHSEVLAQLRSLEERSMDGGRIDIQPASSMRDDLAIVVALCSSELSKYQGIPAAPELGIIEIGVNLPALIPCSCPLASICRNFPNCLDIGSCQGFEDERVTGLPRHLIGDNVDDFREGRNLYTRPLGSGG